MRYSGRQFNPFEINHKDETWLNLVSNASNQKACDFRHRLELLAEHDSAGPVGQHLDGASTLVGECVAPELLFDRMVIEDFGDLVGQLCEKRLGELALACVSYRLPGRWKLELEWTLMEPQLVSLYVVDASRVSRIALVKRGAHPK